MSTETFTPIIDPGTNLMTCIQVTSGAASASTLVKGQQILIKALTNTGYIRLGGPTVTVTTANGYYMAIGDVVRWQVEKGVTHLAYIQGAGAGALSIAFGEGN